MFMLIMLKSFHAGEIWALHLIFYILRKVQKILLYALKSENTFQSFNMEIYEKIFF